MKDIDEKQAVINDLRQQQIDLLKKATKIAMLPKAKRPSTAMNRAFKVVGLAMQCKFLQTQILIASSKPIAKNLAKHDDGMAIVGEHAEEEMIINFKKNEIVKLPDSSKILRL